MQNRHLWYRTQRFPRSMSEAFRDARYGAAIEIPTRPPLLRRILRAFWRWA